MRLDYLYEKSKHGLDKKTALLVLDAYTNKTLDLDMFYTMAEDIRQKNLGNTVNLCSIMNVKSGACSENCRFCAQSSYYEAPAESFELKDTNEIIEEAMRMEEAGVHRFSLVSSGGYLKEIDLVKLEKIYSEISKKTNLKICASHGILNSNQAVRLKKAGVMRYHHNLESSREYYPHVCTTHGYDERICTVKVALDAGLEVCSGGIFGLGETMKDRIHMAFELKALCVNSVPINILNPIPGTPLENSLNQNPEDLLFMSILYRWIMPRTEIRFAGGRIKLGSAAKKAFQSGVNGVLTGNFLTTTGTDIASDKTMFIEMGYELG